MSCVMSIHIRKVSLLSKAAGNNLISKCLESKKHERILIKHMRQIQCHCGTLYYIETFYLGLSLSTL